MGSHEEQLATAIAATAEVVGSQISGNAIAVMVVDLSEYPIDAVMAALARVRRECNRFTLSEVVRRLSCAWPGADEAWASFPKDERETGVVTEEAAQAWAIAMPLWDDGDKVGARMAFRDAYERLIANTEAKQPSWTVTLGWDQRGREAPIKQAIEKGLIAYETHRHLLPAPTEATGPIAGLLTGNVSEIPRDEEARARLEELRRSMEEAEKRRDAEQRAEQEEARRKIEDEKRRVREFVASKQGGDAA